MLEGISLLLPQVPTLAFASLTPSQSSLSHQEEIQGPLGCETTFSSMLQAAVREEGT